MPGWAEDSWPYLAALGLLLVEGLAALLGLHSVAVSALVLVGVPGLGLWHLLPTGLGIEGRALLVPLAGLAAASILVISASAVEIPLTGFSVRALLALPAVAGLALLSRFEPPKVPLRTGISAPVLLGLAAAVCLAAALQGRVVGGSPVPGTDWGHYLLYPEQIARAGTMHLDNPFWMLGGERFHDDPGSASLYGAVLLMSDARASELIHGIWPVALLGVVSVFLFAWSLWGPVAGLVAATVYAAVPMNHTMLGWHGLSNVLGLTLLPLALLALGHALRGRADRRWALLLGLMLVALAAAHRLTLLVAGFAIALAVLVGLWLAEDRRRLLRFAGWAAAATAALGLLVAVDLVRRGQGSGGVQGYRTYLVTKVDLELTVKDLTVPVAVLGVLALAALAARVRGDRALLALHGLAIATAALAYGWVVHFPGVYYRFVYFLPLVAAVALGAGTAWLWGLRDRRTALRAAVAVGAAGLVIATGVTALDRGPAVRRFYEWAADESLQGLSIVQQGTGRREAVVTDRCWGFLAPWLLQRRVLAGIDPADILPRWEARPAATARTILYGGPRRARRLADSTRARYGIVNPGCASDETDRLRLPSIGTPVYESSRLVVLDLGTVPDLPGRRLAELGPRTSGALYEGLTRVRLRPAAQLR